MEDYLGIVLRASFVYIYVLAVLRFSGKRSIGSISTLDFIVALIAGDMFDGIILAEVPLAQGVVGISMVILLHTLVSFAETHSDRIHDLVSGKAVKVVEQSAVLQDGLARERTNPEELWSQLREQGEDDLKEVREASWETSGHISLLKSEAAETIQKRDLSRVKELVKP